MKISDLSKITATNIKEYFEHFDWNSFKNLLTWESVKERLLNNPAPIICVLAVILTITAIFHANRIHKDVIITQKTEISKLQKRAEEVSVFENTQKQYRDFLANVPEAISETKLVEMLSDIALARNVQIISLSPVSKKASTYSNLKSVGITIASENYADTIRFVNDIENSPHLIRIGKWSGDLKMPSSVPQRFSRKFSRQADDQAMKKEYIEAKIEIETVEFKSSGSEK